MKKQKRKNYTGLKLKIDKGIVIPPKKVEGLRLYAETLEVGDSVLFKDYAGAESFSKALNRNGYKAAVRAMPKGFRVWRRS